MTTGAIQSVLVCAPTLNEPSSALQQICPKVGSQWFQPQTVQGYVIDPAAAQQFDTALGPFDYAKAGGFWSAAFISVVALYLVSHTAGTVLDVIRRG